ncbi:ATP-binding protein [Ectobacillus polymachus]|uniref:ATP-binding protein n=1 Tax=Ectobacillus polymachus TaxID=1508806 RepID=UPI003A863FC6
MPVHVQERVFEPFFTNKENGTGLVICKRIMELYGGSIGISCKEGMGTTVELFLPITSLEK